MKEINFEIALPKFDPQKILYFKVFFTCLATLGCFILGSQFDYSVAFLLAIFYAVILLIWKIPFNISLALSILFLVACVLALILDKSDLANTSALALYYFLIIVVIQEVLQLRKTEEKPVEKVIHRAPRQVKRRIV